MAIWRRPDDNEPYWRRRNWRSRFDTWFEWSLLALLIAVIGLIIYLWRY